MSDKALRLIELGLHPVLLGRAGDSLKRPQLKGWQTAVYSPDDVATWARANNVGVRCGETRQRGRYLVVFDLDYNAAEIFPQWRKEAETIVGQPLVIVASGKGYHAYFYTPTEKRSKTLAAEQVTEDGRTKTLKFIETIGRQKTVVTPGSRHPSGKRYKFASKAKYADIPTITEKQYHELERLSKGFDKRPEKKATVTAVSANGYVAGTGELADVRDCLDYARRFIRAEEKQESGGDVRLLGHGGLILTADGTGWYCHSEEVGGGLADLVAWHQGIPLGRALAMLRPVTKFSLYPGEHDLVIRLHEGQFLGDVRFELPERAYLKANTGSGKTTYAIRLDGRVLLVVPTIAILEQLHAHYPHAAVYYQDHKTVQPGGNDLIITTPDSLPRVLELIDATDYTLVVDEAHNVALAGYRKRAYGNVVRCLNGAWRRVILMSGTPLPLVGADLEIFKSVTVASPLREQQARRVVYQPGEKLAAVVDNCDPDGRHLIFLNNKQALLHKLVFMLQKRGFRTEQIALVNADTRNTGPYRTLVENEEIPDEVSVIISTSVIAEGFNIQTNVDAVHFASAVSSVEAQQIVNRFRNEAPAVCYWYNRGTGKKTRTNVTRLAKQILADAIDLANGLNACDEADPNEEDACFVEWRRARLRATSRLSTGQLVDVAEDPETGHKTYEPSPVGVNNAVYTTLKATEGKNPELFKNNTAVYGWTWLDDLVATAETSPAEKQERAEYAEEKAEEEHIYLEYMAETVKEQGLDTLRHNIRNGLGDSDYHALGKAVLSLYDIIGDFDAACDAAVLTDCKTRRVNTMKRQLRIQQDRDDPHKGIIANAVYALFETGERLTPAQVLARLQMVYHSDPVLKLFAKPANAKSPEPLTERKAVAILADYFDLKRCKIAGESGRDNGYELVADCPVVCGVSLNSILLRETENFSETELTEIPGFETATAVV